MTKQSSNANHDGRLEVTIDGLMSNAARLTSPPSDWSLVVECGLDMFARATRFEDALGCFVGLLHRYFGVRECVWGEVASDALKVLPVGMPTVSIPDAVTCHLLFQAVSVASHRAGASKSVALQKISAGGLEWIVLWPCDDARILAWAEGNVINSSAQRRSIELLAKALLRESQWYKRLDERDALIYRDDLTGLFNHRYLDMALENELRRVVRFRTPFAVLFMDIDRFKAVNDGHGHLVGSDLLRQVAAILKTELRDVDVVIRYGGDEFVAIAMGTDARSAYQLAERIRRRVEEHSFTSLGGQQFRITMSIGVAACPEHGRDKDAILQLADDHMYVGKRGGRNRVSMLGDEAFREIGEQRDHS